MGVFDDLMAAANGTFSVNDTGEVEKNADAIIVNAATVFARIEINGVTGSDVKDDFIQTAANAVGVNSVIRPGFGKVFSAITLTSGDVTLVLSQVQP